MRKLSLCAWLMLFCMLLASCSNAPLIDSNIPTDYADTQWTCDEVDISFMVDNQKEAIGSYNSDDSTRYLFFLFKENSYEVYAIGKPLSSAYWPTGAFEMVLYGCAEYTEDQCILFVDKEANALWAQSDDMITLTFSCMKLPEGTVDFSA